MKRPEKPRPAEPETPLSDAEGQIKARVIQNILEKIAGGAVPTEREMRLLQSATAERTQGRPSKVIRWTAEHAATEFGLDRRTLAKKLRERSIVPGADDRYSTRDIVRALFESQDPRVEKDREQARNFRLKNEELERTRIPIDQVAALWESAIGSFGATLKAAKGKLLTKEKINEILGLLGSGRLTRK